jgi:2-polyprenyl-3-methyl-5-hydroxy-6-metoxy-1,4-benzoquinol methylase
MRFKTSRPGVHSVILESISDLLPNNRVLDVGCGTGRLSLMCARIADHVHSIDMSEQAIALARIAAQVCNISNVTFQTLDADDLPKGEYHVVLLSEVIEHLSNPVATLSSLNECLIEGGLLVVSCPSFINFRGDIWMLLQETFDLLMSPSDVRNVYPHHMREWAETTNFSIEHQIGLYYDWAWTEDASTDMKRRIRLAIRDKGEGVEAWCNVPTRFEAMDEFIETQVLYHSELVKYWIDENLLMLTHDWSVPVIAPEICSDENEFLIDLGTYLQDRQIYYSKISPINNMGAGIVYLLRKF